MPTLTPRVARTDPAGYPRWAHWAAWGCVAAVLPSVIWRALVGFGLHLGTPASWRSLEQIPGAGVSYVLSLSALELAAALMAPLMLSRPVRRLPRWLVAPVAACGLVALVAVIVKSILRWDRVDPFHGQPATGWSVLCTVCYLCALAWPFALTATILGYLRHDSTPLAEPRRRTHDTP